MEETARDDDSVLAVTLDVYAEVIALAMRAACGSAAANANLAHVADRARREAAALDRHGIGNFLWLLAKRIHAGCRGCTPAMCRDCAIAADDRAPRDYGRCCGVSRKALVDRLTCVHDAEP
jgi:hypothetical protein